MFIYHYASEPFSVLMTKRQQGLLTQEELKRGLEVSKMRHTLAPYYDHISFFVDPLPLEEIGKIFAKVDHRIWVPGAIVYEHVVDVRTIGNMMYEFVETPTDIHMRNNYWPSNPTDSAKERYFAKSAELKDKVGDRGRSVSEFVKAAQKYIGGTGLAYAEAAKINDKSEMQQYAANVPHVQLYPQSGIVKLVRPPEKMRVGKTLKPISSRW